MLRENLRMIFKNRLIWIIILIMILFNYVYTFIDIYNCFSIHNGNTHEIINYTFLYDKPYAPFSWNVFFSKFSAFLILVIPVSFAFLLVKNKKYETLCEIRGRKAMSSLCFSCSISIVTSVLFFFNYLLSILSFYLTMGFEMAPWEGLFHNAECSLDGVYINAFHLKGYFAYNLYWSNNGNNTFLFFIIIALLFSLFIFIYILTVSSFASLFSGRGKFFSFIIFFYLYFLLTSIEIPGLKIVTNIVDLMKVHETSNECFIRGMVFHVVTLIILTISFLGIKELLSKKQRNVS